MSTIVIVTAGKGFSILPALKTASSASRHRPLQPLSGRYVCPCYPLRFLLAPISNNFVFVKTSADYITAKLTDGTHVNFDQSEHFVFTKFDFYVL